jgi:hypothetical protein
MALEAQNGVMQDPHSSKKEGLDPQPWVKYRDCDKSFHKPLFSLASFY